MRDEGISARRTDHAGSHLTALGTIRPASRKKKKKFLFPQHTFSVALQTQATGQPHSITMEESTRVFVSGLPPTFSNDQLRKHFATRFQVTDAHVLPKRRIGFVGFKSSDVAKEAARYFNKTYMKMSKISVEIAKPVCTCDGLSSLPFPSFLFFSFLPLLCTLTGKGGLETDPYYLD